MPKRVTVNIPLPFEKPDCCADCPLLGLVPKYVQRPKNSKETHVCMGTMEALSGRGTRAKASKRDAKHPLHRPCDLRWEAWQRLPGHALPVRTETFNDCRVPYESAQQLIIKFHR